MAAEDGNALAMKTIIPLGPDPKENGSLSDFLRTSSGWVLKTLRPPEASGSSFYERQIFNPDRRR